jgi:Putative collagen-binding domain of a collagenase
MSIMHCVQFQKVMHTTKVTKDADYGPLLGLNTFDGASLQISRPFRVFNETLQWVQNSANSGHKWVVANDEQGPPFEGVTPDDIDPTHDDVRKDVLWGNVMAGGAGVEYYYGYDYPNGDRTLQDFRTRSNLFDQSRYALEFFQNHNIPFWDMSNANSRLSSSSTQSRCLAQSNGDVILIQLVNNGTTTTVDLTGDPGDTYSVEWFDPFTGSSLILTGNISIGDNKLLGNPPYNTARGDWVVLLKHQVN